MSGSFLGAVKLVRGSAWMSVREQTGDCRLVCIVWRPVAFDNVEQHGSRYLCRCDVRRTMKSTLQDRGDKALCIVQQIRDFAPKDGWYGGGNAQSQGRYDWMNVVDGTLSRFWQENGVSGWVVLIWEIWIDQYVMVRCWLKIVHGTSA